jgi:hypothetical protein
MLARFVLLRRRFHLIATPSAERAASRRSRSHLWGEETARRSSARTESGSVLVLALLYFVSVSLVVTALATWTENDLYNTTNFASARTLQFAATSATDLAIQSIRYTPLLSAGQTLNAGPPSYCWGGGPVSQLSGSNSTDGLNIEVWCSTLWNPSSANTRVVTISTCPSGVAASACALNPTLQAVVSFDDYPSGVSAPNNGACAVYCGSGMTIESWTRSPTIPTASSINPSSGPVAGGATIAITGTGFVSSSTVSLVLETGSTPSPSNVVLSPASVTFVNSTTMTFVAPSLSAGGSYFLTVTTPSGTSPYGPIYTFQ